MDIFVCSDDKRIGKIFTAAAKAHKLYFIAAGEAAIQARKTIGPALFYLDLGACTSKQVLLVRRALALNPRLRYALIDATGEIADVAAALRAGALDYLGPKLCRTGITAARLKTVLAPLLEAAPAASKKKPTKRKDEATPTALPTKDWASVRSGGEYLFHMLYIELEGHKDIGLRSTEATVDKLLDYFRKAVEAALAPAAGRLWIWTDFSGIVLFPSAVSADAVTAAAIRFMLSRRVISVNQDIQKLLFSYRLVLIDGSTIYRERGKTDRIISDAVNSLSHLGAKFAKPGHCYLAQDIYNRLSAGLQKCFAPAGTFEGRTLFKMKLPARY